MKLFYRLISINALQRKSGIRIVLGGETETNLQDWSLNQKLTIMLAQQSFPSMPTFTRLVRLL